MTLDLVRLISTDWHGIGNKGNSMLDFIYSHLLQKYGLDYYRHIKINQISDKSLENIFFEGDKIHINFIFHVDPGFSSFTEERKNEIRLTIIHQALVLFSERDKRFSKEILDKIHNEILEKKFDFEIDYLTAISRWDTNTSASVTVNPSPYHFDVYLILRKGTEEFYRVKIFRGKPSDYYLDMLFSASHWKNSTEFVVSGLEKEVELHLRLDNLELGFENLTPHSKPPLGR